MRADEQGLGRGWSGAGGQAGCVCVCVCVEQERQPQGSLPLWGTHSCAQSQVHSSHPYKIFGRAPYGTALLLSLWQVSMPALCVGWKKDSLAPLGQPQLPAQPWAHGPGGSTLSPPGACSALAASTQGLDPSTSRHNATPECQGTAGIPHSWILICPGHMALFPPGSMGFTKTDVLGIALSQTGPTGLCLPPAWQWEGKTLPWGATPVPGDPGAHAAYVHCFRKHVAGLDQNPGSGYVPQRCCAAGAASWLAGNSAMG